VRSTGAATVFTLALALAPAGPLTAQSTSALDWGVAHTTDASSFRSPGSSHAAFRGLLVLRAEVDLEAAIGLPGATVGVDHQTFHGASGSAWLDDVQGVSNIDAHRFSGLGELWLEQRLAAVRLKVGRVDANAEFVVSEHAGGFLNAAMGLTPTVFMAPTYPSPAPSVNAFVTAGGVTVGSGLYDVGYLFGIGEARLGWQRGGRAGRLVAGAWKHGPESDRSATSDFVHEDMGAPAPVDGAYVIVDQTLWADGARSLAAFGLWSGALCDGAEVDRHAAAGVVWHGVRSAGDALGVGFTRARLRGDREAVERVVEAYYTHPLGGWLTAQLDVQYIGGSWHGDGMVASTVRIQAEL
jgi:carbohydrate-selective porin OprB